METIANTPFVRRALQTTPAAEAEPEPPAEAEPAPEAARAARQQQLAQVTGAGPTGRIVLRYGSQPPLLFMPVINGQIQNAEPSILYLDSGPFYANAVNMLRNAGYQVYTYDGSHHAANYQGRREPGEIGDVELLPDQYMDENDCVTDDVQTVYHISFQEDSTDIQSDSDDSHTAFYPDAANQWRHRHDTDGTPFGDA
jgi:hypothetical protein